MINSSENLISDASKKLKRLAGRGMKSKRLILKIEMLIYQSKAGLDERILFGKITHLLVHKVRKVLVSASYGNEISMLCWTCNKSLSRQKREKDKKREGLVILGMLINIHELSSLASIFKMTGLLSTVSSKLEWAIVKEHRRASLCCIIVLSMHMIGYWFFL